jgi:hypothetical protein
MDTVTEAVRARMRRSFSPVVGWAAAVGLAVAIAVAVGQGCYNPTITDGGLLCASADAGGSRCPEGFRCNPADNRCHKTGGTCAAGVVTPICQELARTGNECNPTCQYGCACGRCNVRGSTAVCTTVVGTKKVGETCATSTEKDDCAPGLICLAEVCGGDLGRCYQHCTTREQCKGSMLCQVPIEDSGGKDTGFRACDLPAQDCDPIGKTGCPHPALTCYLSNSGQTYCDCANNTVPLGGSCSIYNDCAAGLACVSEVGLTGSHCRSICLLAKAGCVVGQRCIANGTKYGFCGI